MKVRVTAEQAGAWERRYLRMRALLAAWSFEPGGDMRDAASCRAEAEAFGTWPDHRAIGHAAELRREAHEPAPWALA